MRIYFFLEQVMGLRDLRRAPALSLKMPNSIGIFYARFLSHILFKSRKQKSTHFVGTFSFSNGAPTLKESWKKILEYLIENVDEVHEDILKIEKMISL